MEYLYLGILDIIADLTDCIISFICYFVAIDSCMNNNQKILFPVDLYTIKYLDRIPNFNDF